MAITVFDPDERKRNNMLATLQMLQTLGGLAKVPSEIQKAKGEADYYKQYSQFYSGMGNEGGQPIQDPSIGPSPIGLPQLNSANIIGGNIPLTLKGLSRTGATFGPDPLALEYGKRKIKADVEGGAEKAKQKAGATEVGNKLGRYLKQYGRSLTELRAAFPDIGKTGTTGWAQRRWADVSKNLDNFPETKSLESMASPFAQELATQIEGRATDQDRDVQRDRFADVIKNPSLTNVRNASNHLLELYQDKGAEISKTLKVLDSSGIDVLQSISEQVYEEAPELRPQAIDSDDLLAKYRK